jgi:hypothetical protein
VNRRRGIYFGAASRKSRLPITAKTGVIFGPARADFICGLVFHPTAERMAVTGTGFPSMPMSKMMASLLSAVMSLGLIQPR